MIRLTPAVYWNILKKGVDVISRYLKTLARTNISEKPVVSVIARLICMQVNNAAFVYRIYKTRDFKILLRSIEECESKIRGYAAIRYRSHNPKCLAVLQEYLLSSGWVRKKEKGGMVFRMGAIGTGRR